jgi:diaminopimelate epimerase
MGIIFNKMSGCGNDFILIDNREKVVPDGDLAGFAERICRRRVSVGADGLILIEKSATADFKWRFFNTDGSSADLCGNGARCAARFAFLHGIAGTEMVFETGAGKIRARVDGEHIRICMPDPSDLRLEFEIRLDDKAYIVSSIDTGVPHLVVPVSDLEALPVAALGRALRFHPAFEPAGTNIDFVSFQDEDVLAVRTYERGVEDETLACGTGSVAAAVVSAALGRKSSPVRVLTRSGEFLTIHFRKDGERFRGVLLEGGARMIYRGELQAEALC